MKKIITLLVAAFAFVAAANAQFSNVTIYPTKSDVGIFIIPATGGDTAYVRPVMTYKEKNGSGIASGLTYGLVKVKNRNLYKGTRSAKSAHVGDVIRFSFGEIDPAYANIMFMFLPKYNIGNFSLGHFEVKKDHRELVTGNYNIWNSNKKKSNESDDIEFEVYSPAVNVYEAKIVRGEPGEYCFVFTDNGSADYTNVFDFSLE